MTVKDKIVTAEELTNTNPTEGQKVSGNYKKGKFIIKGLKISIENPIGTERSGINKAGIAWSNTMKFTYGYFNGTVGKDGDPIDVYLGPIIDQDFDVYVVDQVDEETRSFDEHKVMFGFRDRDSARDAYMSCFNGGWKGFSNITTMSLNKFKMWLKNADQIKYPASKLSMSSKIDFKNTANQKRIKVIKLDGEVVEDETLKNLQKQAGDPSLYDVLVLEISSPGGSVSEGLMIMVWLDSLSQSRKEIVTVVTANAYSIASLIMLAADHRIISRHGKVMVHNPMVPELKFANANELEKYASELRDLESIMYELYQIFTGLNQEQIKALMDNETYLTPQEAVDNGFADVVLDIKPKPYSMAINNKKEINMSKTLNLLNRVIGMVNKTDFVNQLYYTESGEVEIFQKDPATYAVGDRTSIQEGEVRLSDGSKLLIEDFMIKSIDKSIEETVIESPVDEFNEGAAPKEILTAVEESLVVEPIKQKGDMPSSVIETVESVKTTTETMALETEESIIETPIVEKPIEALDPIHTPEIDELKMMVEALSARVAELEGYSTQSEMKFKALNDFENLATEAIDALATSTVSNFQPVAKAKVEAQPKGSIFQTSKQKRGL